MEFENDKYIGSVVGIYKVLYIFGRNKYKQTVYHVKCTECGCEKNTTIHSAERVHKCRHIGRNGNCVNRNYKFKNKKICAILRGIRKRCYYLYNADYRWYGAKGVKVCDEWLDNPSSFEEWALNNGYADDLTIDRIDENKDYCPENCRWISREENSKYKSTTREINVDGEIHTGREWAKILGLNTNLINKYVRWYGLGNTIEFIRKYRENPELSNKRKSRQSLYDLYMII